MNTCDLMASKENQTKENAAWANVAALPASATDVDASREHHDDLSVLFGATKMTLLKNGRPLQTYRKSPSRLKNTTVHERCEGTTDTENSVGDASPKMLPEENACEDLSDFPLVKQTTRLDMPKLRDRWWALLQKSVEEKQQH